MEQDIKRAEQLYQDQRYEEALAVYEQAIRQSASKPDPRLYYGQAATLKRLAEQAYNTAHKLGYSEDQPVIVAIEPDPRLYTNLRVSEQSLSKLGRESASGANHVKNVSVNANDGQAATPEQLAERPHGNSGLQHYPPVRLAGALAYANTYPAKSTISDFFQVVYEEYKKPIATFLYRLLAQKDQVEDLYQEILTKFWVHLQNIRELPTPEETKKWLFTVARYQVVDQYRRQGKLTRASLEEAEEIPYERPPMEEELGELERLQWVFTHMSPQYRICLVLQDLYGYSQYEIATLLKINEKTVSTNVFRGRRQFLAVLDEFLRNKGDS